MDEEKRAEAIVEEQEETEKKKQETGRNLLKGCLAVLAVPFVVVLCVELLPDGEPDKPEEVHEALAKTISDYFFAERQATVGRSKLTISMLPGFDPKRLDHWRALLKYGETHAGLSARLGNAHVIWFVNTNVFVPPDAAGNLNDDLHAKIFAGYWGYTNGKSSFMQNPFNSFDGSYFEVLEANKSALASEHEALR